MMAEQPSIETGKDILFLLTGTWDDADGGPWLCADCCTMEGALLINPHWKDAITIVRVEAARPRGEIVALLDADHQNAPTLVLADKTEGHEACETVEGRRIMTDPKTICRQLAQSYGGARPS
jgi:hypothetical protein